MAAGRAVGIARRRLRPAPGTWQIAPIANRGNGGIVRRASRWDGLASYGHNRHGDENSREDDLQHLSLLH